MESSNFQHHKESSNFMKNLTDILKKYFLSRFFLNYRIFLDQKRSRQCITWEDSNNLLNGRHQRSESCNQCPTVNIVQTLWLIRRQSLFRKKNVLRIPYSTKNQILQFSKIFLSSVQREIIKYLVLYYYRP